MLQKTLEIGSIEKYSKLVSSQFIIESQWTAKRNIPKDQSTIT